MALAVCSMLLYTYAALHMTILTKAPKGLYIIVV
jgi:hypothetical protein